MSRERKHCNYVNVYYHKKRRKGEIFVENKKANKIKRKTKRGNKKIVISEKYLIPERSSLIKENRKDLFISSFSSTVLYLSFLSVFLSCFFSFLFSLVSILFLLFSLLPFLFHLFSFSSFFIFLRSFFLSFFLSFIYSFHFFLPFSFSPLLSFVLSFFFLSFSVSFFLKRRYSFYSDIH